jgi:hypothetical protein
MMNTPKINGAVEFVSVKGESEGIDDQINDWIKTNPNLTIVDVEYRMTVYQDDGKNKLVKLALVLFQKDKTGTSKTLPTVEFKQEPEPKPGARTMVMSLRQELSSDNPNSTE